MPQAAKVRCSGGCGRAVDRGYCEACRARGVQRAERKSANDRGYNYRWQQFRVVYLQANPLCVGYPRHVHEGRVVLAECVDHIAPHKGDQRLFWDEANMQALCIACNSRKAVDLEGAFGRGMAQGG